MPHRTRPVVQHGSLSGPQISLRRQNPDLVLRPFVQADVDDLVEAYRDPAIQRWHVRTMTAHESADWISQSVELWATECGANWALQSGGRLAGRMGLKGLDLANGCAEVAYWVRPEFRRRGLAVAGVDLMANWCLHVVGLHRLELQHSTQNLASCRVATKARFAVEGTLRESGLHEDGWHDMHVHARLASN